MRSTLLACLFSLVLAGCADDASDSASGSGGSGSGGSGSGGGEPAWGDPGTPSGDPIHIDVQVQVVQGGASLQIGARDLAGNEQLSGGTVTVTPEGGAPVASALYAQIGFPEEASTRFRIDVEHPVGSRTGIVFIAPSRFEASIVGTPKVGEPTMSSWSPSGEAGVSAYVVLGSYGTPTNEPLPDTGTFEVPASAFDAPTLATLTVSRVRYMSAENLSGRAITTETRGGITVEP
jgi:hypothetical protein